MGIEERRQEIKGHPLIISILEVKNFNEITSINAALGDQVIQLLLDISRDHVRGSDIVRRYQDDKVILIFPETEFSNLNIILNRVFAGLDKWKIVNKSNELNIDLDIVCKTMASLDEAIVKDFERN